MFSDLILTGWIRTTLTRPVWSISPVTKYEPELGIMYREIYSSDYRHAASEVFDIITRHEKRREKTSHPLARKSVRLTAAWIRDFSLVWRNTLSFEVVLSSHGGYGQLQQQPASFSKAHRP